MGHFYDIIAYAQPVTDPGWRVALYPPGTSFADALAQETEVQGERGNTVDPATAFIAPAYFVRGTADYLPDQEQQNDGDHGWRDVVSQTGTVVLRYRMS